MRAVGIVKYMVAMWSLLILFLILKLYINNLIRNIHHFSVENQNPITHEKKFPPFMNRVDLSAELATIPFHCIETRTKPNFTICIYDVKNDVGISGDLVKHGVWDIESTYVLNKVLSAYPTASFIDVGGNIGYFSLLAAARGRNVIAVEPADDNILQFHASVYINKFVQQITLFRNAVSDERTDVIMSTSSDNQGYLFVREKVRNPTESVQVSASEREIKPVTLLIKSDVIQPSSMKYKKKTISGTITHNSHTPVKTIFLDDLIPAITKSDTRRAYNKTRRTASQNRSTPNTNTPIAIMKIDIEGYECHALRKSSDLFSTVFIPYIIMEWTFQLHEENIPTACTKEQVVKMREYLVRLGYSAFVPFSDIKLHAGVWGDLSTSVIWKHKFAKRY